MKNNGELLGAPHPHSFILDFVIGIIPFLFIRHCALEAS